MQSPRLGPEQIARYHEYGFVVLGPILTRDEIDELLAEERRFRHDRAYGGRRNRSLFVAVQMCDRSEPVRRIAAQGRQLPAVAQLLGSQVCFTHVQFVTKLPDTGELRSDVPWHQDSGYGEIEPLDADVTVWVPLCDTDERNGGLRVLPRSHRLGLLPHESSELNPVLRETRVESAGESVPLRAGEAVAFPGTLLHATGPNRSTRERVGFFLRYCRPDVRLKGDGDRSVLDDPHTIVIERERLAEERARRGSETGAP